MEVGLVYINYREAKREDIEDIYEIEKYCFSSPWSKKSFIDEINNKIAFYIVAEYKGKVVGYAGMWMILDEGHVTNIAVHPEYQGIGIGKNLVNRLFDVSKKNKIINITLEVRESNIIAKDLYIKLGFLQEGIRKGYYSDTKEDAIIMWRSLQ